MKPTIIAWAGIIDDPFGTNSISTDPLKLASNEVFQDLKNLWGKQNERDTIIGVVSCLYVQFAM